MKFLDADVKKPLASVTATIDEGNIVVFEPQESYDEPNLNQMTLASRRPACTRMWTKFVNGVRPKQTMKHERGVFVCVMRIEEVGDVEHDKSEERRKQEEDEEEFGERKTTRNDNQPNRKN